MHKAPHSSLLHGSLYTAQDSTALDAGPTKARVGLIQSGSSASGSSGALGLLLLDPLLDTVKASV